MNRRTKIIITGLICLVIGYFAGREHLKYQMRTAMQDAVKVMQTGLASALNGSDASPPKPTEPETKPEDEPIGVALVKKGFDPKDIDNGKFEEDVTFTLQFANKTGKDIRAFDGVLEFTDLLGNRIIGSKVEINERIAAGQTLSWEGALEYNQFMDDHQRLRSEPMENLKVAFHAHKILFADNSTKEYE